MSPRSINVRSPRLDWPAFAPSQDAGDHPLFRGPLSRWTARLYAERLSPAARGFFLATVGFTHFTFCSLEIQSYLPLCYALGMWITAFAAARLVRPRTSLRVNHADRVGVGERLPVDLCVERLGGSGEVPMRAIPHRLPMEITAEPALGLQLPPARRKEAQRGRIHLRCAKRGVYTLSGFRVETFFPFGLIGSAQRFGQGSSLLVYPSFTPLIRLELGAGRKLQPGGVALASTLGDTMEYLGNREYRWGDSIRDIDWRATARLNRPIVREFREEYFVRVAVILDTHVVRRAAPVRAEDFERAVSMCAAVGEALGRQEYLVDIFAAGPTLYHLTSGRSLAFLDQILDILACVESGEKEPFTDLEPEIQEHLDQITTVVCVFLDWDEVRRDFVQRLRERGASLKVVVVRDGDCTLEPFDELGPIPVIDAQAFKLGVETL